MSYLYSVITLAGIFGLVTLALNLQFGFTGLINFGIVAYFAIGAYAYAIVTISPPTTIDRYAFGFGASPWLGLVVAIAAAVAFAAVTGWPTLRLRGEYLALTTFAFAEVVNSLLVNVQEIGNGTRGVSGILPPLYERFPADSHELAFLVITVVAVAVLFAALSRLGHSPFGATLMAIRDDELAVQALGKPVSSFRMKAFLAGAAVAGVAGALYASFTSFISPGMFTADITFTAFIALVIGGLGSNVGALAGAAVFFGLEELIRSLELTPETAQLVASLRLVPFGLALILILRLRPQGLLGKAAL